MSKKTHNYFGKDYNLIQGRLKSWRDEYPPATGWALVTEWQYAGDRMIAIVSIISPEGVTIATGSASQSMKPPRREDYGQGDAENKKFRSARQSFEHLGKHAETSARGRALNAFGGKYMSEDTAEYDDAGDDTGTTPAKSDHGSIASKARAAIKNDPGEPKAGDRFFKCVREVEKQRRRLTDAGTPIDEARQLIDRVTIRRDHSASTLEKKYREIRKLVDQKLGGAKPKPSPAGNGKAQGEKWQYVEGRAE